MIRLRDLVSRIRLELDKRAADTAQNDAKGALGAIEKAAFRLGSAIGAAFAIDKIKDFAVASVRAAVESDRVWNRLAGTLRNAGVNFENVEIEIRAAAKAMQELTTLGDEDFAAVLQDLVTISNDYEGSLRNVGLVADLAAAKQIDLGTAAQLVGKVMVGETGTLKRYGIVVKEGSDAIEEMRRRFAGMAENEASTLGGKLDQLNESWGEFKETLGATLINIGDGAGAIDLLTHALRRATDAMEYMERIVIASRLGIAQFRRNPEKIAEALGDMARLEDAARRRDRAALRTDEIASGIGKLSPLLDHIETPDEKDARLKREVEAAEARVRAAKEESEYVRQTAEALNTGELAGTDQVTSPTGIVLRDLQLMPVEIQTVTSAFQSMFRLITIDGETAQETLTQLGVALTLDGMQGIARLASAKARENLARAVEEAAQGFGALARGNPGAALHFKAAAEHGVAAGLWKVLGGAAGGSGTRTSSGAGYTSSQRDLGGTFARNSDVRTPVVIQITMDPLSPTDARAQRFVKAAHEYAQERYGADGVSLTVNTRR